MKAVDFFPSHIKLFTKRVTNTSLNFGSGNKILFLALDFLILVYGITSFYYFFLAGAAAAPFLGFLVPYLERLWLRPSTPEVSNAPRTI